jgi:hypothetical protein
MLSVVMRFVTVAETSLDAFLAVSARSPYQRRLEEYPASLLEQRCTKPEQ